MGQVVASREGPEWEVVAGAMDLGQLGIRVAWLRCYLPCQKTFTLEIGQSFLRQHKLRGS